MSEVTFTEDTLRYVSLFQNVTRTTVVDCLEAPDRLIFVVKQGDIGRAIGKGGENVTILRKATNKEIHIIEYSDKPEHFVRNVFHSYDVKKVDIETRENGVVHATVTVNPLNKGRAIGREGRNLRVYRDLIARHHPIDSVSVA